MDRRIENLLDKLGHQGRVLAQLNDDYGRVRIEHALDHNPIEAVISHLQESILQGDELEADIKAETESMKRRRDNCRQGLTPNTLAELAKDLGNILGVEVISLSDLVEGKGDLGLE